MSAHTFTCMWFYPFQLHVDVFASVFSYQYISKTLIFMVVPSRIIPPPPHTHSKVVIATNIAETSLSG